MINDTMLHMKERPVLRIQVFCADLRDCLSSLVSQTTHQIPACRDDERNNNFLMATIIFYSFYHFYQKPWMNLNKILFGF
mmetsp:Transcript_5543/g.8751  ORF Transcript_5543/g.8751 Transcript_5543/m.8751 type:complete len:80 (+) Transcript_5543:53-292(+)